MSNENLYDLLSEKADIFSAEAKALALLSANPELLELSRRLGFVGMGLEGFAVYNIYSNAPEGEKFNAAFNESWKYTTTLLFSAGVYGLATTTGPFAPLVALAGGMAMDSFLEWADSQNEISASYWVLLLQKNSLRPSTSAEFPGKYSKPL